MQVKKYTLDAIAFNYFFAKGKERNTYDHTSNNHMFYEGDTIYSFGHHFPLAVKCRNGYILNGDTYSNSTSQHQSIIRSMANKHEFITIHRITDKQIKDQYEDVYNGIHDLFFKHDESKCSICKKYNDIHHEPIHHAIIPLSSLEGAHINPKGITLIDITKDFYTTVKVKNKDGKVEEKDVHHLGASLFRVKRKLYLSSLDYGSRRMPFFLVRIRSNKGIRTVEQAFRELAANLTDEQYKNYQAWNTNDKELFTSPQYVKRQGEYFLIPHPELKTEDLLENTRNFSVEHMIPVRQIISATSESTKSINQAILSGEIKLDRVKSFRYKKKEYLAILYYPEDLKLNEKVIKLKKKAEGYQLYHVESRLIHRQFDLAGGTGNSHTARDAIRTKDGKLYIRGTLRHPEHRMIRMGEVWHEVVKNTALESWSANGNVD